MALAAGEEEGLVKVICGKKHGEILGAHVPPPAAPPT